VLIAEELTRRVRLLAGLGPDLASAETLSVPGSGAFFHINGTATIRKIAARPNTAGRELRFIFTESLTLVHNANLLILPTGADLKTEPNDAARFKSEGADIWRCIDYQRADGTPLATGPVLKIPSAVTPSQTAEGSAVWAAEDGLLTVGTGATRRTMADTTMLDELRAQLEEIKLRVADLEASG